MFLSVLNFSSIGIDKKKQRQLFDKVNLLYELFGAELWSFDPSVDPSVLRKLNQFGSWVFVIRNKHRNHGSSWYQINQHTLAIDAGIKVFETIYNVGTGDVFMVGHGLGDLLKKHNNLIRRIQRRLDCAINDDEEVSGLKNDWDNAMARLIREVSAVDCCLTFNLRRRMPSMEKNTRTWKI